MVFDDQNVEMGDFPQGLRVLVVDDDFNSLSTVERFLQASNYQVTTCQGAKDAISLLRGGAYIFDIVLTEIYMQEIDGFQLLEVIRQETDYLPVVLMSSDGRKEVIMKGVNMGACDILLKPIRIEEISVIWQHVFRRRKNDELNRVVDDGVGVGDGEFLNGARSPVENCGSSTQERNDEELNEKVGKNDHLTTWKKPRMIWTPELHQQFVVAVNSVGLANAVPKKILEHMKVAGLTRENVASHLQKYRIHLQRRKEKKFNRDAQYHPHHQQVVSNAHNQIDYVSPIHHFPISQTTSIVVEGGGGGGGDQHAIGVSSSIYHHRHHHGYNYQTFSESSSTFEAIRYQETFQGIQRIEGEQYYNHHNHNNNNNNEYINNAAYYAIPMAACATTMIEVTEEDDATKYDPQETQQQQQQVEYHQEGTRISDCINFYPYDHNLYYPAA